MSIVTLISDLGSKDHYVALVKATLLNNNPTCLPIDVTHEIGTGETGEAAFLLRSIWNHFPLGTVHVNGVASYFNHEVKQHLVVEYDNRFVITADNGFFPLAFPNLELAQCRMFKLDLHDADHVKFPMSGAFAVAAARITQGEHPETFCEEIAEIRVVSGLRPYLMGTSLYCHVLHIDHFGNCYFNITEDEFEDYRKGRSFAVIVKHNLSFTSFNQHFAEVEGGRQFVTWAQNGYLMITMNVDKGGEKAGTFNKLIGLKLGDSIQIDFHGDPNR